MNWRRILKRLAVCSTCGQEFRKHRVAFPSLVGFSYCSPSCEAVAWARWVKGVKG